MCSNNWIRSVGNVVFFGGAGVSTESGIPDFRSTDGLYHQTYDFPPETILSHDFLQQHPEEFYRFYRDKLIYQGILPNATHKILAKWEQEGFLKAVVTQNIDGLHSLAGSRRVFELHGSIERNYCVSCGKKYGLEAVEKGQGIPRCSCGGMIRPDVVLYGEGLEDAVLTGAVREISRADVLIVGGTSLAVYPAAGLLRYFQGSRLVLINRTETPYDSRADVVLHAGLGQVMTWLDEGGDPACFGKEQK